MKRVEKYKYLLISVLITFITLITIKTIYIYYDINNFKSYDYNTKKTDLDVLTGNMKKVANSIFDNIINTPKVIEIFKYAHQSNLDKKSDIRHKLHSLLDDNYKTIRTYGIQQLHFHLPNNESFLRFHKPNKYGDDLTSVRDSVSYVNKYKKPISGFEEGRIFNGYRYVYPLFDKDNKHIGSVEISSSLLNFKKVYESTKGKHLDFILKKDVVEKKVFSSQLNNYSNYFGFDNFLIQKTLSQHNKDNPNFNPYIKDKVFKKIFSEKSLTEKIDNLDEINVLILENYKILNVIFIPLLNDFNKEKVGYTIFFNNSKYFEEYFRSEIINIFIILTLSILIGLVYQFYKNHSLLKMKINEQNKKLLKAQRISKMGFWELDLANNQLYWSDEIYKIFEIDPSKFEASYEGFLNVIHPEDRDKVNEAYSNSLVSKQDYSIEHRLLMPDGRIKWVREECSSEFDNANNPLVSVGVVIDITTLHITKEKLVEQTYIDDLTKLNNRKSYNENIKQLLSQYNRYKTPFSIIMYDIDDFKQVNDTYGHATGDKVLIDMSELIKSHLRDSDYIFRIGGEEFIILLTETQLDKAKSVSEKIRYSVENNLKTIENQIITISIGLTEVKENDNEDTIFMRVDDLLYKSKESGKNRVSC